MLTAIDIADISKRLVQFRPTKEICLQVPAGTNSTQLLVKTARKVHLDDVSS